MGEEYDDEFTSLARDALNPELDEAERIEALKAAIQSCMGGEEEESEPKSKPTSGLALVFGGPKKKSG